MGIQKLSYLLIAAFFIWTHVGAGPVMPLEKSGSFALEMGPIYFEVDPATGGRITSLKWNGEEYLYLDKSGGPNWGSTFWPSPQKSWRRQWGTQDWPPSETLDKNQYSGGIQGAKIVLKSEYDEWNKIFLEKTFEAGNTDSSIIVTYTMHTKTDTALPSWAPWEISRLLPNGMIFFPTGPGGGKGQLKNLIEEKEEHSWFFYDKDKLGGGGKVFVDGKGGWLAHVDERGMLLVKKFPEVAQADIAENEAEVEIYCDPQRRYWEMEQQGAFREIRQDSPYAWPVKWYLRKLPAGTNTEPGSKALLEIVNNLIKPVSLAHYAASGKGAPKLGLPFKVNPLSNGFTFQLNKPGKVELILNSFSGAITSRTHLGRLNAGNHHIPLQDRSLRGMALGRLVVK